MLKKDEIIKKLGLIPLPDEGGYYRETYRDHRTIMMSDLGLKGEGKRNLSTAIYYMISEDNFSALHRLKTDEIFHFYMGVPVEMIQIYPNGEMKNIILGSDILSDQKLQVVVPGGVWQGTRLVHREKDSWALLGTTMAPGFDFCDFELADRAKLIKEFPNLKGKIYLYTRE